MTFYLHLCDDLTSSSGATLSDRNCGVRRGRRTLERSIGMNCDLDSGLVLIHRMTEVKTTSSEGTSSSSSFNSSSTCTISQKENLTQHTVIRY